MLWSGNDAPFLAGLALEKFTEFRRTKSKQGGRGERGEQADLRDKQRAHGQPVQAIAGGNSYQNRLAWRLADGLFAILVALADLAFHIADQGVDALVDGGWIDGR